MSTSRWFFSLGLLGVVACTTEIPADTAGDPTSRQIPASGVIRGSVLYQGPHPCSQNGHIVGNAILLVFDRRNPPPPNGLATTAVNFVAVTGDLLFPNEPRWGGSDRYCPLDHGIVDDITVTAPYALSPLAAGSYVMEAFFDYTGNFLPTFKFRNLPEMGDVGGGNIDTAAALQPVNQNPNYLPHFLPIDIGTPQPLPKGSLPGLVPSFSMPAQGYVADNVNITIGKVFENTRPYFYPQGLTVTTMGSGLAETIVATVTQSSDVAATNATGIADSADVKNGKPDPNYAPILEIPQDIQALGPPGSASPSAASAFEASYPRIVLRWGTAPPEVGTAQKPPFNMQITPFSLTGNGGGFRVWQNQYLDPADQIWKAQQIPEGNNVPNLWPLVVLSKLVDDPTHQNDPASLQAQGDAKLPVVIMEGITLFGGGTPLPQPMMNGMQSDPDSLLNTVEASGYPFPPSKFIPCQAGMMNCPAGSNPGQPTVFVQDHLTVMLRPAVICFDQLFNPNEPDKRGNLVSPYLFGNSADMPPKNVPIVPLGLLQNDGTTLASVANLVKPPPNYTAGTTSPAVQGCLPTGRYSINVVYPTGQAWTVPNEAGACTGDASGEGATDWNANPITCTIQPRPVLRSQGPRAVVEITKAKNPMHCQGTPSMNNPGPVPQICITTGN
ncbi:MAG TPA: hypothetical protein VF765_11315 [Polyangiaceae bacterium]